MAVPLLSVSFFAWSFLFPFYFLLADSGVDTLSLLRECVCIFPNGAGRTIGSGFGVVPVEEGFASELLLFDIFFSPVL